MNPLDRFIGLVAPRAAVRREAARFQLEELRRYDAGGRGRRLENWKTSRTSADAAMVRLGFEDMRDRARDLVRNNPYAARIISLWETALIAHGWSFKAKAGRRNGGRRGQTATDEFRTWAKNPILCDWDGRQTFDAMMAQAARARKESGEVLIRMRVPSRERMRRLGLKIPLQLQVLECDWIATDKDGTKQAGTADGGWINRGIEYDADGSIIYYWLYNNHPGEANIRVVSPISNRVPADEIIHIFRPDRPGQTRGVTCFSPVLIKLRDLDDYMDAQLLKQKISACLAGVIVDIDGSGNQKSNIGQRIEPGTWAFAGPGQDVRFSNPPSAGELPPVVRVNLLAIAVGTNVPYELLTGDFEGTNFSAGRLGWQNFNLRTVSEQNLEWLPAHNRVAAWWFRAASIVGIQTDGLTADWTPPPPPPYDPAQDVKTKISLIRALLTTPQEAIREQGLEPEDVLEQLQEWNKELDKRGIVVDTDPRKVSAAGLTQARPLGSELPPTGEPPADVTVPPAAAPANSPP